MPPPDSIDHILKNLPRCPGVYKMKNKDGDIIYVGKAKNLKSRVSSYFQSRNDISVRTVKMVEQISDIEYIEVGSELEALILETNFIKELRPKYNILMKDDKNYVYIKITVEEDFPRVFLVRKVSKDRARYFGPKTAAHKVIKTLKVLKKIFPFRHCQLTLDSLGTSEILSEKASSDLHLPGTPSGPHQVKVTHANIKYPCLDYHIKRCAGPCIGKISALEYRKIIDQVIRFLEGKHDEIIQKIHEEMLQAAAQKKFELAASIRDKLQAVQEIIEVQRISDPHQKDMDIVHYVSQDCKLYFNLFQLRNGKLIGQENFLFNASQEGLEEDREALTAFFEQYYEKATDIPKEILIPHELDDREILESWLKEMKGQKVNFIIPERGKKNQLLELSLSNARSFAQQSVVKWQGSEKENRHKSLERLQELLNLSTFPFRLECYDNSHFGGTETVSSMVVFENGFPKKADYRHFKLHQQTAGAPDDFASMEETLTRRLQYLKPVSISSAVTLRQARKKDTSFLLAALQMKELPHGDFWLIYQDKHSIGFIHTLNFVSKKILVQRMGFLRNLDIQLLVKKILEKSKVKRLYLLVDVDEIQKYEAVGCEQIRKIPPEFSYGKDQKVLVYDATKYVQDSSFKKIPQLILVDGGKGQLSSAQKALKKFDLNIPMISLAKREEEIFLPYQDAPILLKKNDPLLHMIQHIRDESHRFAITYHQKLRLQATTHSVLDTIPGVGPELKLKLLKKFGSVEGIRAASGIELEDVVGKVLAERVRAQLGYFSF